MDIEFIAYSDFEKGFLKKKNVFTYAAVVMKFFLAF